MSAAQDGRITIRLPPELLSKMAEAMAAEGIESRSDWVRSAIEARISAGAPPPAARPAPGAEILATCRVIALYLAARFPAPELVNELEWHAGVETTIRMRKWVDAEIAKIKGENEP